MPADRTGKTAAQRGQPRGIQHERQRLPRFSPRTAGLHTVAGHGQLHVHLADAVSRSGNAGMPGQGLSGQPAGSELPVECGIQRRQLSFGLPVGLDVGYRRSRQVACQIQSGYLARKGKTLLAMQGQIAFCRHAGRSVHKPELRQLELAGSRCAFQRQPAGQGTPAIVQRQLHHGLRQLSVQPDPAADTGRQHRHQLRQIDTGQRGRQPQPLALQFSCHSDRAAQGTDFTV